MEYYKLVKFVSFNDVYYPRLVRIWYANLGVMPGKLSTYVMNKQVMLDMNTMVDLFEIDGSTSSKLPHDFEEYNKEEATKLLFPNIS